MVRGRIGLLVVAGGLVGAAALALQNPGFRAALIPGLVLSWFQNEDPASGQPSGQTTMIEPASAVDHLGDTAWGLVASDKIAASAGNRPVFIDEVVSGYGIASATSVPKEITTIRPVLGCLLTRPMPGSLVGHVTAGQSRKPIGMTTYGEAHLAEAVAAFVDAYRQAGPEDRITLIAPQFETYDVVVTETGAPVYLVLETVGRNQIWNIHVAEGVQIERVVLLGGEQAGVANLDAVVPVEVILGPGLAECGIVPGYAPTLGQTADASESDGLQPMSESTIAKALAQAEAYDIWFRDTFEVLAGESRIGFDRGGVSVVGPVASGDAPTVVWVPFEGAKVRTTHDKYLDIAGQQQPGEDFSGRVLALVTHFAQGDLERLRIGGDF